MTVERRQIPVKAWATGLLGIACAATAAIAEPSADALDALIAAYPSLVDLPPQLSGTARAEARILSMTGINALANWSALSL